MAPVQAPSGVGVGLPWAAQDASGAGGGAGVIALRPISPGLVCRCSGKKENSSSPAGSAGSRPQRVHHLPARLVGGCPSGGLATLRNAAPVSCVCCCAPLSVAAEVRAPRAQPLIGSARQVMRPPAPGHACAPAAGRGCALWVTAQLRGHTVPGADILFPLRPFSPSRSPSRRGCACERDRVARARAPATAGLLGTKFRYTVIVLEYYICAPLPNLNLGS